MMGEKPTAIDAAWDPLLVFGCGRRAAFSR